MLMNKYPEEMYSMIEFVNSIRKDIDVMVGNYISSGIGLWNRFKLGWFLLGLEIMYLIMTWT